MSTIKVTNLRHESATSDNITLDSSNNAVVAGTLGCTGDLTVTSGNLVVSSGNGIDFSATSGTGTSELFDDYEEGETTITALAPNVSGTITIDSTNNKLWYRKIGSLVVVGGAIDVDSVSSPTGFYIQMTGLPFVVSNTSALKNYSSGMANVYNSNTAETGQTPRPVEIPSNGQTKLFILTNCANISSSTQFQFNFSYWTTA